jgi:hypothetical protein
VRNKFIFYFRNPITISSGPQCTRTMNAEYCGAPYLLHWGLMECGVNCMNWKNENLLFSITLTVMFSK